jgi:triosephosphate isomerase
MRTPLVAGNWKMNGSQQSVEQLCEGILSGLSDLGQVDIAVCPPAILVSSAANILSGSSVSIGGQDVDINASGAYTGQTSAAMLKDAGCNCVIVGHSERRQFYGDTDELVAEKTSVALAAGLLPLVCVGETLQEREADVTETVIRRQLQTVIDKIGIAALANCVVAYEPVWAIGTGVTASPEQAQEVHAFIRQLMASQDANVAAQCRILYGGSMKPSNAADLISRDDIDGGLIGGAALVAEDFLGICKAAV